jgi:hypothetical protein
MAAIDKLYGNRWQYEEFYEWCNKFNKKALDYFYERDWDLYDSEDELCITNFPQKIDEWMLENCPIKWVTDQIKEQYGM